MAFEQAQIDVQKTAEFEQLKAAVERVFSSGKVEGFLRKLQSGNVQVREFEKALSIRAIEAVDSLLAASGKTAQQLYAALTVSDQAMMREFYLERIEKVESGVREKFRKAYQYY